MFEQRQPQCFEQLPPFDEEAPVETLCDAEELSETIRAEARAQSQCIDSEDFREGVAAFLQKRPARFKGR